MVEFLTDSCPGCGCVGDRRVKLRPDTQHYAEVRCGECNRFLRWLPKPPAPIPPAPLLPYQQ